MQRWLVGAALGLFGTVVTPVHAQPVTHSFQQPSFWFVGPGAVSGVQRGPVTHPILGPIGADQIAVDQDGDGIADRIHDLPADIRNDTQSPSRFTLEDRLSPTQRVLYTRKFPRTFSSPAVCGGDIANSQVYFHRLDAPPAMTFLGTACLRGTFSRQPAFYEASTPGVPSTAMIVAAPSGTSQSVGWFDLASGGEGVDGSSFQPNVSVTAEGVQVSPFGNAFYIRHRTGQAGQPARYSIVDLCASPTGGAVTTRDEPSSPGTITVQHRIDGSDLSAVVSFSGQPTATQVFALDNCFQGPPPELHRLTVTTSGIGVVSSTPTGIASCGVAGGTCGADFAEGTTVTLSATPLPGGVFHGWGGDCAGSAPTHQVVMSQDRICTAEFRSVQLAISKTATPSPAVPGETLTYSISYANSGNLPATGVAVSDTLPAGTVFVAAPNGTLTGRTVTWNVGNLAAGGSGQVELQVQPTCQPSVVNAQYSIDSAETLPRAGATVTTPVSSASLSPVQLSMTSVPGRLPLRSGDLITHTLTLTNTGADRHPLLRLRFGIGDAVAFGAVSNHGTGTLTQLNPLDLEWIGPLDAGASTSVVFTTIVVDCFTFDQTRFNYGGQPLQAVNACGQFVSNSVSPPGPFPLERPVDVRLEFVGLPAGNVVAAHPGTALELRITLTNRLSTDQPAVSIASMIPSALVLAASPPFVSPTDPGATWDAPTRTVSWSGTVPGNGTITITLRGTLDPAASCRSLFEVRGTRGTCGDLSHGVVLFSVPPSPSGEHILAVDQRHGLYRWEPGIDRNYREVLCVSGAEFFAGADRTPAGDVWVAGLPSLRLNVSVPAVEVLAPEFLDTPALDSSSAHDVAHDPTTNTLVFSGAPTSLKRYDPATGQTTDLTTQFVRHRVMIEPDGTIATGGGNLLYRIDPANLGSPQILSDPRYAFMRSAIALTPSGTYVAVALRQDGTSIEDLVEIDPATGSFTLILADTHTHTHAFPGAHGPVVVAPDGTIYLGDPGRGSNIFRIERTASGPVVTSLSAIGSVINPVTPGVVPIEMMDFVFVPAPSTAPSADLAAAMTAAPDPVAPGGTLTYTLTVQNLGPDTATQVVAADPLPASLAFQSAGSDPACTATGATVTCALGDLAPGQSVAANLAVVVSASAVGSIVNTATLSSGVADPVAANNSATATVNVTVPPQDADLSITKTTPAASINLGTPLRYDLVIVNIGPSSAASVVVTDPLPAGVLYDATASSPSCAESGGTVTCFLGALPAGATVARAIVVMPTQAGTLVNIASVSSATADPQAGNNSAGVTVEVVAAGAGENIDPSAAGEQYAYGENVGWLNLEPLGDGGPGVEVTSSGLTGWMWGENVGWCSLSCATTGACGTTDYGVTNDGAGQLGGFAWCENVGWVSFACENTNSCSSADYGVAIDPSTGIFAGTAWGENLGWIAFEGSGPVPYQIVTSWRGSTAAPPQ